MKPPIHYRTQIVEDLERIGAQAWNRLVSADPDSNPFLRYEFLHALHASGCAVPRTGWTPAYLTLADEAGLAAAVPLYRKDHSFGEYVFDWAWARAHEERGLAYYPKWLAAVPFTPAPGSRLLARDASARAELVRRLLGIALESRLSSLHVLLAPAAQIEALAQAGLMVQRGIQFHWYNRGYDDFEQFLQALSHDKRKKIRAERRKVCEAGVQIEWRAGARIREEDWRFFHRCYRTTYAQHGSIPYLNLAFFQNIARTMPDGLLLVMAYRDGRPVASALGVFCTGADRSAASGAEERLRDGTLYGRYWGATEFIPCLHFECCYYQMIEFAIEHGIAVFEGGAQGVHKVARGLEPVPTRSAHFVADEALARAIAAALARQERQLGGALDELAEHTAFKAREANKAT